MPQYLAPGVYVEEIPPAVRPIAGVGTSTAGFVGTVAGVAMPPVPAPTPAQIALLAVEDAARIAVDAAVTARRAAVRVSDTAGDVATASAKTASDADNIPAQAAGGKGAQATAIATVGTDVGAVVRATGPAAREAPAASAAATRASDAAAKLAAVAAAATPMAVAEEHVASGAAEDAQQRAAADPGSAGLAAQARAASDAAGTATAARKAAEGAEQAAGRAAAAAARAAAKAEDAVQLARDASAAAIDAVGPIGTAATQQSAQGAAAPVTTTANAAASALAAVLTEIDDPDGLAANVAAAATSAVAAGAFARRPLAGAGTPVPVDGWEQFTSSFGDIQDGNRVLAHAVYGFFLNGGGRCWVARLAAPVTRDTVGDLEKALAGLALHEDIALVAVPGADDPEVQNTLLDHCESTANRFAILDGPGAQAQAGNTDPSAVHTVRASSCGALYYPWLHVPGEDRAMPPSGHVAGVYARVDQERGVHKAPANEVLRGVTGVDLRIGRTALGELNVRGVNVIRQVDTTPTIWGARTLAAQQPEYVPTRRMLIFLRGSIEAGLQWVVFEPNSAPLWSRIERNVRAFLLTFWESGALAGSTPQEAFFVQCNDKTNTAEAVAAGRVTTEIGVALVKPAEFVVFRINQLSGAGL